MSYNFYTGEVLLIDKPYTWSSFQAVNKIKYAIKKHPSLLLDSVMTKPKVGHAGTLDPLATGLLIVCTGKKQKALTSLGYGKRVHRHLLPGSHYALLRFGRNL